MKVQRDGVPEIITSCQCEHLYTGHIPSRWSSATSNILTRRSEGPISHVKGPIQHCKSHMRYPHYATKSTQPSPRVYPCPLRILGEHLAYSPPLSLPWFSSPCPRSLTVDLKDDKTALTALLTSSYPHTTQRISGSARRTCRALGLQ